MTSANASSHSTPHVRSTFTTASWAAVAGRVLLSVIFLLSGYMKIGGFTMMTGYAGSRGLPAPKLMIALAIFAELAGGLSLLFGFLTRVGALGLFIYLIPTTLVFHNYWAVSDPMQHQDQMIHFLKNLAIMGGLLMVVAAGPGPASVDAALPRRKL